jgi:hypothetical protein
VEQLQGAAGESARDKDEELKRVSSQYEQMRQDFSVLTTRHEELKTIVETLTRENMILK